MTTNNLTLDKNIITALVFGHFLCGIYNFFINPIMPLLADKLNISLTTVGFLYSISFAIFHLIQPFIGYLSDLMPRAYLVFYGVLLYSIPIGFLGYVNQIWLLALIVVLKGLGVAFYRCQSAAIVGYFSKEKINTIFAIYIAAIVLGHGTGPLVSSFITEKFGLEANIFVMIPGIIMTALIYKMFFVKPVNTTIHRKETITNYPEVFKSLIPVVLFTSFRHVFMLSFLVFMPFLWREYNISTFTIGVLFGLLIYIGAIAAFTGGYVSNFINKRIVLMTSVLFALPCFLLGIYFLKTSFLLSSFFIVLMGFFVSMHLAVDTVVAQTIAPQNRALASSAIEGTAVGIGFIMVTPVGFIASIWGIQTTLVFLSFSLVLSAFSAMFIPAKYVQSRIKTLS